MAWKVVSKSQKKAKEETKKREKRPVKPITLLCCFLLIVLAVSAPSMLKHTYVDRHVAQAEETGFKGILNVLLVSTWDVGRSSRSSWMQRRSAEFEKKHPGVLLDIRAMDVEQMAVTEAAGLPGADILCFGTGALQAPESLQPWRSDVPDMRIKAAQGRQNEVVALPLMFNLPVVLTHDALCAAAGAQMPANGVWDAASLRSAVDAVKEKQGKKGNGWDISMSATSSLPVALAKAIQGEVHAGVPDTFGTVAPKGAWQAYAEENRTGFLVGTTWEYYRMQTLLQNGRGFSVTPALIEGAEWSDQVQWIALTQSLSEEKRPVCEAYIRFVLSESVQKTLKEIGVFSVLSDLRMETDDMAMAQLYKMAPREIDTPDAFLWKTQKDLWETAALHMLSAREGGAAEWAAVKDTP